MRKAILSLRILVSLIFFAVESLSLHKAYAQSLLLNTQYIGIIQQKISSCVIYPPEAREKNWEGIARVRFTMARDGQAKKIEIAESSGYPLLDAAAMLAINDASPYPFPKGYHPGKEIEITVPINYYIKAAKPSVTLASKEPPLKAITPETLRVQAPQEIQEIQPSPSLEKALPAKEEMPPASGELTYFVDLSLKNNPPIKVAREEIELAHLKVTEAQRNFFPGIKLQSYSTDGKVVNVAYEEREAKVQIDQPIYYSGRLKDTLKQAQVNLKISQKNYDRLKLDITQKTETAYYNLVASKIHLMQKQTLREEAKEILEKIERLYAAEMIIPLEVNSAKSWFEQIESQIKSIQHDLYMAELTFKQVLNKTEAPKIQTESLERKKINLDLTSCTEIAFKNRPELYLSELLVKFNEYGKKIEGSKSKLAVDFTGSYGQYQGHDKTDPWKDSSNWYLGVKASLPLGASTLNSSYAKDKTKARFGQTSATESATISSELNLLDNLKRLSDRKKADIDFSKASSDFNETSKTIIFEVQDAFLKCEKAGFQLDAAESEMKFRKNEVEVIKIRALVGESNLSNALEAMYSFSEAQTRYIQALANYYISLVSLKKATGYGLKI